MTNDNKPIHVLIDLNSASVEPATSRFFQTLHERKPGPVRALPVSDINWALIEEIPPHPESQFMTPERLNDEPYQGLLNL